MWTEIGGRTEAEISEHDARYRAWARSRLLSGEMVGAIAEAANGTPVGSGLVWFRPEQPYPQTSTLATPYILSMYTVPEWRGKGIASRIVRDLVTSCRKGRYPRVVLHASKHGRGVYGRLGFERSWEMRYQLDRRTRRQPAIPRAGTRRKGKKGLDRAR